MKKFRRPLLAFALFLFATNMALNAIAKNVMNHILANKPTPGANPIPVEDQMQVYYAAGASGALYLLFLFYVVWWIKDRRKVQPTANS